MKRPKLRITLTSPHGTILAQTELDLTEAIRDYEWSPANTAATPNITYTWILEDYTGPGLRATAIFNDNLDLQ